MKTLLAICLLTAVPALSQQSVPWPEGKRVAVSLSFDDARASQTKVGLDLLKKFGAKVTFYVGPRGVEKDLAGWKRAVAEGHEIGNHSTFHPCSGNFAWSRKYSLEQYTVARMEDDIDSATRDIENLLGVKTASFAYPCGSKFIGRGVDTQSYVPLVAKRFRTARGFRDEAANDPIYGDFAQILGVDSDGMSFEAMKQAVLTAAKTGGWLVFAGHEIGKAAPQTTQSAVLEKFLAFAKDPANGIWLNPVDTIAKYIEVHRPAISATAAPRREAIEWTDVWMPNTNENALPRVLLLGDSITRGYYAAVEEGLKGKAYVARITTSKAIGDPALATELAAFLQQQQFDVVHFNVGMHGWAYTEDDYRRDFPALLLTIRRYAPQAKLVWATTTPVRKDRAGGATNARIEARNRIVQELAAGAKIPVADLHAVMSSHSDLHSDDVHFTKEGSALMAAEVASVIAPLLPRR